MVCSNKQSIEPLFAQLFRSSPAWMKSFYCSHTLLLSSELCHVTSAKRGGLGPIPLGFSTGLRKWVMIWRGSPKILVNNVASGRALLTVQETPPLAVGKQT